MNIVLAWHLDKDAFFIGAFIKMHYLFVPFINMPYLLAPIKYTSL